MKKLAGRSTLCSVVCAVLMLALLVCQFVPFWTVPETGESVSISRYIWFPDECDDLEDYLQTAVHEDFTVNELVLQPVLMLALSALGAALCFIKRDSTPVLIAPIACGLIGIWGYLAQPALQLGGGWVIHLTICIAMAAVAAAGLITESWKKA